VEYFLDIVCDAEKFRKVRKTQRSYKYITLLRLWEDMTFQIVPFARCVLCDDQSSAHGHLCSVQAATDTDVPWARPPPAREAFLSFEKDCK